MSATERVGRKDKVSVEIEISISIRQNSRDLGPNMINWEVLVA